MRCIHGETYDKHRSSKSIAGHTVHNRPRSGTATLLGPETRTHTHTPESMRPAGFPYIHPSRCPKPTPRPHCCQTVADTTTKHHHQPNTRCMRLDTIIPPFCVGPTRTTVGKHCHRTAAGLAIRFGSNFTTFHPKFVTIRSYLHFTRLFPYTRGE